MRTADIWLFTVSSEVDRISAIAGPVSPLTIWAQTADSALVRPCKRAKRRISKGGVFSGSIRVISAPASCNSISPALSLTGATNKRTVPHNHPNKTPAAVVENVS